MSEPKRDSPILLLPLRLEIRYFEKGKSQEVGLYTLQPNRPQHILPNLKLFNNEVTSRNETEEQYWIRWYPDNLQIPNLVGRITQEEEMEWKKFHDVFLNNGSPSDWMSFNEASLNEDIRKAWLTFAGAVTPERALQIIRHMDSGGDLNKFGVWNFDSGEICSIQITTDQITHLNQKELEQSLKTSLLACGVNISDNYTIETMQENEEWGLVDSDYKTRYQFLKIGSTELKVSRYDIDPIQILFNRGISLPTIPETIVLFTIKDGIAAELEQIQCNKQNLTFSPADLEESDWINNFEEAVRKGMGAKVNNPTKVNQIHEADWLVAVGFHPTSDHMISFEEIIRRSNALGNFAIVPQDTPTNNTETTTSPYSDQEAHAIEFVKKRTTTINNLDFHFSIDDLLRTPQKDAGILAKLLGIDPQALSHIPGAELEEQVAAAAMTSLIVDICLDFYTKKWKGFRVKNITISENVINEIKNFVVQNVRARGNLPIIRFDNNPYGILPVLALKSDAQNTLNNNDTHVFSVKNFLSNLKKIFIEIAKNVPTLHDTEPEKRWETFQEIMRTSRVSKFIDLRILKTTFFDVNADPKVLDCPLVKDRNCSNESESISYLNVLSTDFNNMIGSNSNSSLLHRFIDLSQQLQLWSNAETIKAAATILKSLSTSKLEILLMEVLDIFSHRLDPWLTGLAYENLVKTTDMGNHPYLGVFGFLEQPGVYKQESFESEYIQSSSESQANAIALLRNAAETYDPTDIESPFQLNLSSEHVRKGLWFLEGLRKGRLPEELLGYQLERMIHESTDRRIKETDIYDLREKYPLTLQVSSINDQEDGSIQTVIDGLKFLKEENRTKFKDVKAQLNQIFDAANDITVSELVYQLGENVTRAAAWMDYIEGKCPPPEPEFIQTRRTGNFHGIKIFMPIIPPTDLVNIQPNLNTPPRQIVEPILSRFSTTHLTGFDELKFTLTIHNTKFKDIIPDPILISLKNDLGLNPIDLVVGGKKELLSRTRFFIFTNWKRVNPERDPEGTHYGRCPDPTTDPDCPYRKLGQFPIYSEFKKTLNDIRIDFDDTSIDNSQLDVMIKKAELLQTIVQRTHSENKNVNLHPNEIPIIREANRDQDIVVDYDGMIQCLENRGTNIHSLYSDYISRFKNEFMNFSGIVTIRDLVLGTVKEIKTQYVKQGHDLDKFTEFLWEDPSYLLEHLKNAFKSLILRFLEGMKLFISLDAQWTKGTCESLKNFLITKFSEIENILVKLADPDVQLTGFIDILIKVIYPEDISIDTKQTRKNLLQEIKLIFQKIKENIDSKITDIISKIGIKYDNFIGGAIEPVHLNAEINSIFAEPLSLDEIFSNITDFIEKLSQIINSIKTDSDFDIFQLKNSFVKIYKSILLYIDSLQSEFYQALETKFSANDYELQVKISRFNIDFALEIIPRTISPSDGSSILNFFQSIFHSLGKKRNQIEIYQATIKNFKNAYINEQDINKKNAQAETCITLLKTVLQYATDQSSIVIFTPYLLPKTNGSRPKWDLDYTGNNMIEHSDVPAKIGIFSTVKPAIRNILSFLPSGMKLYEDKRYPRNAPSNAGGKIGNSDFYYLSETNAIEIEALICLVIEDWQEFYPNKTERTGITLHHDIPQSEAPNVLLLAVPDEINSIKSWTHLDLADIIIETIDLFKIRMVSSNDIIGSNNIGMFLPSLIFDSDSKGNVIFPYQDKSLLHPYQISSDYYYVLANKKNIKQVITPEERSEGDDEEGES